MKILLVPFLASFAVLLQLAIAGSSTTCNCGWINKGRIVNGNITSKHKYPFATALIAFNNEQDCGGSIITPWHVLTAAHCCSQPPQRIKIKVGVNNWRKESGDVYEVEKVYIHEEYDVTRIINDIAILVSKTEIKFSQNVGPICLPNSKMTLDGQQITAIGWGNIKDGGPASDLLREVQLRVVSRADCIKQSGIHDQGVINRTICHYGEGKGTCQRDSGGPIVWRDPDINRLVLVGAVSFGGRCGGTTPGFDVDVSGFLDWIGEKIADSKPGIHSCSKV